LTPEQGDLELGQRIRLERERQGRSLRKLAADLDISPSALSQIETNRSRPSVRTLYMIVSALGISFDALFAQGSSNGSATRGRSQRERQPLVAAPDGRAGDEEPVVRRSQRKTIELDSGVVWERLNAPADTEVEVLEVTYDVGGCSSGTGTFVRHSGREYGVVVTGRLRVTLGFTDYELEAGDAISFDSAVPHRLEQVGDHPVKAMWFVLRRSGDDRARWTSVPKLTQA
jgi:transcriptional regulator with XRE-family HTH domain